MNVIKLFPIFALMKIFTKYILVCLLSFWGTFNLSAQIEKNYISLSKTIINTDCDSLKLIISSQLSQAVKASLNSNIEEVEQLDSTSLLYDLISDDRKIQIVSWSIEMGGKWEYFGYLKSYNEIKKKYFVYELTSIDFSASKDLKIQFNHENWPGCVYTKLIENEHNKRKYYTLLGWIAPIEQTAFKLIEVLTISKGGKPYFGKTKCFKKEKTYESRVLFSYNRSSKFLLVYGEYQYQKRKWNKKKKRYDMDTFTEDLIVFDHLISQYPGMEHIPEFLVPTGNLIDAYQFINGKWVYISDIDARNLKRKEKDKAPPKLDLFEEKDAQTSN
jgi:hypothetical protein